MSSPILTDDSCQPWLTALRPVVIDPTQPLSLSLSLSLSMVVVFFFVWSQWVDIVFFFFLVLQWVDNSGQRLILCGGGLWWGVLWVVRNFVFIYLYIIL